MCSSQSSVEHCRLSARSLSWHSGWPAYHAGGCARRAVFLFFLRRQGRRQGRRKQRRQRRQRRQDRFFFLIFSPASVLLGQVGWLVLVQVWACASLGSLKKNEVSGGHSVPPLVAPRRPRRLERTRGRANLSTALAQGLPMCPERVRCVFGRDALLQPSCTRQDICWGKEPQWMRDRAGQARHVRNPELLQHPSQSRAARQQTPAPNWNATTLLSSHMLVACPAEPAPT